MPTIRIPLPPPPATALSINGYPMRSAIDSTSRSVDLLVEWLLGARHDRHPGTNRRLTGRGLTAHQRNRLGSWADEGQPRITTRRGEVFVLGEEPIARMHGVRARIAARHQ